MLHYRPTTSGWLRQGNIIYIYIYIERERDVYIYIYIYIYICMYSFVYILIYLCTPAPGSVVAALDKSVTDSPLQAASVYMCVCMCIYIYIYIYVYTYIYIYVYVCVHIHIHIYIYIHIHIHTYTSLQAAGLDITSHYRVSTEVTFGQGALSIFPLVYFFRIAHR